MTEIENIHDPRLAPFATLTERQLRSCLSPEEALFIAESPKVIRVALDNGMIPTALLCERRHLEGDAADILDRIRKMEEQGLPHVDVYTGSREILASLTGYTLTRGVLCAMRRPKLPSVADVCRDARRVCVIYDVTDTTNIGAIFRSAAALSADAVVVSARTCDPLNRRSVRVSMGTVFVVPWTVSEDPVGELRALGFTTLALALKPDSVSLRDESLRQLGRIAVVMGTEGEGLPDEAIAACDRSVIIPMRRGVDSLNVAAASAVAMWELF